MHRVPSLRQNTPRQMPIPREKEHMRKMPHPLLPPRYEGKSKNNYAFFRSADDSTSPSFSSASRLGWTPRTSHAGKKTQQLSNLSFSFGEQFLSVPNCYFVKNKSQNCCDNPTYYDSLVELYYWIERAPTKS